MVPGRTCRCHHSHMIPVVAHPGVFLQWLCLVKLMLSPTLVFPSQHGKSLPPLAWCQAVALFLKALIPWEGGQSLEPSSPGLSLSPSRYMRPNMGLIKRTTSKGSSGRPRPGSTSVSVGCITYQSTLDQRSPTFRTSRTTG